MVKPCVEQNWGRKYVYVGGWMISLPGDQQILDLSINPNLD
jgi:hypothetical protein